MEQTFEEYLKQARKDFAKVAARYSVDEHLELRTAIDSLLIAYDQATDKALSIADVGGSLLQSLHQDLKGFQDMGFLTQEVKVGLGIAIEQVERCMRREL